MELEAVAYGVLVRVVRGLAGRLGGLGGLGGSGCRRVSGEGAASESGLVSKSLVSRARFTQIAGASSGGTRWHGVLVRVVRGLAGRLGGLGGLGGSGCRRVSGEGAASESGLVSKSLVSRAGFTQIAGASSGGTWWCTHPLFWSMRSRVALLSVRAIAVRSGLPAAHLRITRFPRGRGHVPEDVASGEVKPDSIGWGLGLGQLPDFYHFSAITGSCQLLPF